MNQRIEQGLITLSNLVKRKSLTIHLILLITNLQYSLYLASQNKTKITKNQILKLLNSLYPTIHSTTELWVISWPHYLFFFPICYDPSSNVLCILWLSIAWMHSKLITGQVAEHTIYLWFTIPELKLFVAEKVFRLLWHDKK